MATLALRGWRPCGALLLAAVLLPGCAVWRGEGAAGIDPTSDGAGTTAVGTDPPGAGARESPGDASPHYAIEVSGPNELRAAVLERTLIGRWQRRPGYDPDQFDALLARAPDEVRALARAAGYFDARIEVEGLPGRVFVRIEAGARTTVGRLDLRIEGAAAGDRRLIERLNEAWLLPEGSFFRPETWEQGKRALIDALGQAGYLRAVIRESRAEVDVVDTSASLRLALDSGPRLGIGPLRISGLKAFNARLVEDLRPFSEGDPYSIDRVLQFQQRLAQVGYFTAASVLPDLDALERDRATDRVPLLVDVNESRLQRVALGVGYSSDYGARAQIAHDHRHLFGSGWQSESVLLVETRRQRAFANLRSPLDAGGWFTGLGSSAEQVDIAGERVIRTQTYAGRGHRFADGDDFYSLAHQHERRSILLERGETPLDSRTAWVAGWSRTLRRLDSPLDPRRGHVTQLQLSGASKRLGSDRSFVRVYARTQRFWPAPVESLGLSGGVLIGLAEVGGIAARTRDDIPSENLFRAGGSQSVRGYRFQSLGVAEGASVTGGRFVAVFSLEYQFPISDTRRLAIFADRGNATDSIDDFRLLGAYGLGLRWRTPIGPLMLDLAKAEAADRPRLHFSVGYGF